MIKTVTLGKIGKMQLGDVFEFIRNGVSLQQSDQANGIPITRIETIADGNIDMKRLGYANITDLTKHGNYRLHKGDILMSHINSMKHLAKCALYDGQPDVLIHGMNLLCLRPKKDLLYSKYALYYLRSKYFLQQIPTIANQSVNQASFSVSSVKKLILFLPSLTRQRQIASILDRADALRQKDRQLLEYYDQLAQSTFLNLFGDPVSNEKGWELVKTGAVIDKIVAGDSYGGEERPLKTNELGVLKVSAVTSGRFRPTEYKAVLKSTIKKKVIFPRKGDLLFSRANTRELVGATCIVDKDYDTVFLPDKLWRLDLAKDRCNPFFLKILLSQKIFRYELTKTATGTSGSMLNISMDKLRDLLIWLPPLPLQQHFATIIERIERQKSVVSQQMAASEALFQRLLQDSFGD